MVGRSRRDSTSLIAGANDFLDRLQQPKTLKEVEKNISTISRIKEDMLSAGFNASFPEMMMSIKKEFVDEEIAVDLPKQLRAFREFANLKKYTLNRVRVALAAHKIYYNMFQRGTTYEITNYLPFNGQYLHDIIYLGEPAVRAYNAMRSILSKRKEDPTGEYTVVLFHGGKKETMKLQSNQNLNDRIARVYGKDAVVVSVTKRSKEPQLVRNWSTRVAVAAAYAKLAAKKIYSNGNEVDSTMTDEHQKYAKILAKEKLPADMRVDLLEKREALEDRLYSEGLLSEEEGTIKLDEKIVDSISNRRTQFNKVTIKEAETVFANNVLDFFMSEPKRVRSSYPLFPGISTDVDERYTFLSVISDVQKPQQLIESKLKLETMVPMSGRQLGAAYMHLSGKSTEWCSDRFHLPEDEIKESSLKLSNYMKPSAQAKKFLDSMSPGEEAA